MKITIKATKLDLTPSLKTYITEKLKGLAKLVKRFDGAGAVEVWVEVARTTKHHHKGLVFSAEADIRLPGKVLRAVHADRDIRVAVDRLRDKLHLEVEKYKTRRDERRARKPE